jgi:hypothetical protein
VVRPSEITPERLRRLGWQVDDLKCDDVVVPYRASRSLEEAKAAAAENLPSGTAVSWSRDDGRLVGGFIVGHEGLAPPLAGVVPAFVLWPDLSQDRVEAIGELAALLRERMGWLAELALEAGSPADEVAVGRAAAVDALARFEAGGRLMPECCGPFFDVRCSAGVEPVGRVRWDGFREGWEEPAGPPASERRHPIRYDYGGPFLQTWRRGVDEGIRRSRRASM